MDPFGQLPSHLPFPLLAPGLNGPSVQSAVEVVLRPGQGAMESFGSKAAILILVLAGHLGPRAVSPVALDKEQDGTIRDRLKHNNALLVLVPQHLLVPQLEGARQEPTVCFHSPTRMSSIQDVPWRMLMMVNPGAPPRQMPMVSM